MKPTRWGQLLVAAVPTLFIGYFFVYPLVRILALGLSVARSAPWPERRAGVFRM